MKTREKIEKKSRKGLYLALIIAFLMVTSIAGYVGNKDSDSEQYKYNKHLFVKVNNGWLTTVENRQVFLNYGPKELENLSVDKVLLNELNNAQKIYISFNPDNEIERGVYELQNNVFPLISTQMVRACTDDVEGCEDKLIKNCSDASQYTMIISIKRLNETKAVYNNNCLDINGDGDDLIKIIDKVILRLLGII